MSTVSVDDMPVRSREALLARALTATAAIRRVDVLGVGIDDIGLDDAIALMRAAVDERTRRTIVIVNAHTLNLACASRRYRAVLNAADFVFNDGAGIRLAARLQGIRLRANLNGTDLIPMFMRATDENGLSYYLVGARPEVLARTVAVMRRSFPGWSLAGHHHGYLGMAESDHVIDEINRTRPHLVLVGMGNPLQETWIDEHRHRLDVPLCIGVGGLFSYLSGDYTRAPLWMRRCGLEWLAIIALQPKKWRRYVFGNPLFLMRLVREHLTSRLLR